MADKLRTEENTGKTNEEYINGLSSGTTTDNSGTTSGTSTASGTSQSTYDYLRSAAAKELLDSNIQMSIARQNSARALNSYNNSIGLGGTGYSGVQATGIQNAYLNGLTSNTQNYQNTINDIDQQEISDVTEGLANDVSALGTALSGASSEEYMDKYLASYGLTAIKDSKGNLTGFSGDMWNNMNDSQKAALMTYYNAGLEGNSSGGTDTTGYSHASDALTNWTMENGENANIGNGYGLQSEIATLFSDDYMSKAKDGKVVKLVNNNRSDDHIMYAIYKNGKWYRTTSSEFRKAKGQSNYDIIQNGSSQVKDWSR